MLLLVKVKLNVGEANFTVGTLVSGAGDWVVGRTNGYTGITVKALSDDQYIKAELGDGTGQNPWGGNYTVAAGTNPYDLVVTVTSVPDEACNRLAAKSPQAACSSGTVTYTIQAT